MKPTRDSLWAIREWGKPGYEPARPITPEEFHQIATAEGYVKTGSLIGKSWCEANGYVKLDVNALVEQIVIGVDNCFEPSISDQSEGDAWLDDIAREVKLALLAALDGEDT